jgi:hypothetical protein
MLVSGWYDRSKEEHALADMLARANLHGVVA